MAAACASVRCGCRSPPIGLAAISPSARYRACQRIALALPTPNRSAAYPHEAPAPMAAITRSRRSSDKARAMMLLRDPNTTEPQRKRPRYPGRLSLKGSGSSSRGDGAGGDAPQCVRCDLPSLVAFQWPLVALMLRQPSGAMVSLSIVSLSRSRAGEVASVLTSPRRPPSQDAAMRASRWRGRHGSRI